MALARRGETEDLHDGKGVAKVRALARASNMFGNSGSFGAQHARARLVSILICLCVSRLIVLDYALVGSLGRRLKGVRLRA